MISHNNKSPKIFSSHKGFTLIEVLLTIGIIAILSTIVIVAINPLNAFKKARDTQRLADIRNIENAINMYLIDQRHAPYLQDNCSASNPSDSCFANETAGSPYSWNLLAQDLEPYLAALPRDPCGAKCFVQDPLTFFSYNYYAPGAYMYACNQSLCPKSLSSADAAKTYSIYAENMELREGMIGLGMNPFHSY